MNTIKSNHTFSPFIFFIDVSFRDKGIFKHLDLIAGMELLKFEQTFLAVEYILLLKGGLVTFDR